MKISILNRPIGYAVLVALLGFACNNEEKNTVTEPLVPNAKESTLTTTPYKLTIFFDGLIAFVEDDSTGDKRVWALLVDAKYKMPTSEEQLNDLCPMAGSCQLPPCVKEEAIDYGDIKGYLINNFPIHVPHIRFRNAKIKDGRLSNYDPSLGESLENLDVRIGTGTKATSRTVSLDKLGSDKKVRDSYPASPPPPPQVTSFDTLKAGLLGSWPVSKAVIARVLIEDGNVEARPIKCDMSGGVSSETKYYFRTPVASCPGSGNEQYLAEEVVVVRDNLTNPVEVMLTDDSGKVNKIELLPASGNELVIEVLNVTTQYVCPNATTDDCPDEVNITTDPDEREEALCSGMVHPRSYRWFYQLSNESGDTNCADHYYPCIRQGTGGGRKCPQRVFKK